MSLILTADMCLMNSDALIQAIDQIGIETLFLMLLAPIFLISIGVEAWWWARRDRADMYSWRDTFNNSVLALSRPMPPPGRCC